ncbi:MAG: M23 family metallopeptidase, partial [Acidobacteria bacterium]|nr:M23 family metallopeptidase [Acidobacteriota bacterium]
PARAALPAFSRSDIEMGHAELPARLRRGETMTGLFERLGVARSQANSAARAAGAHLDLRRLRAGDRYFLSYDEESALRRVSFEIPGKGRLGVRRQGTNWLADFRAFDVSSVVRRVRGVLRDTLQGSLLEADGSPILATRMADVLQWDLDFHRDLRRGDRFEILFEEIRLDGEPGGVGEVLALRYENRGRLFEAYRFGEAGHYDAEGRPLRKLFLRSPLRYSRITSRFSNRRLHPVTKTYRPHWGVDYGAAVGTPVRSTANGVVHSAGWSQGGGNVVKINHADGYQTAYLHLSRFASGVKKGRRVGQGETVGFVGQTGLTTAPHLDYRVQRYGRWINPASLDNEPAAPIPSAARHLFIVGRDLLRAQLDSDALPDRTVELERVGSETVVVGGY